MPSDIEIVVRRRCRHGQTHPHHFDIIDRIGDAGQSWCTEGDHLLLDRAKLISLFDDELASVDPRMERTSAPVKAKQLVEMLDDKLRAGTIARQL